MRSIFASKYAVPRKLLLALIWCSTLLINASPGQAAPRSTGEVEAVIKTWIENVLVDGPDRISIRNLQPVLYEGEAVAYIAHLFGGGYCLAGADDLSLPVIFYAPEGQYDPTNLSLQYFLDEIRDSLLIIRQYLAENDSRLSPHLGKLDDRADLWDDLVAGRKPQPRGPVLDRDIPDYLVLPVTSQWDQRSPYNDECPTPNGPPFDGIPSKVGCVATAMSQIMYYWKWPARGEGSREVWWPLHPFGDFQSTPLDNDPGIDPVEWAGRLEWTDSTNPPELRVGGTWDGSMFDEAYDISDDTEFDVALAGFLRYPPLEFQIEQENFLNSYYQWDLMQDTHTDDDGLDAGDAAVAKLCWDASVAAQMNWGRYESSTSTGTAVSSLEMFFKYDSDATYYSRNVDVMVDELTWGRPVLLRGTKPGTDAGHAWVVMGYDTTASSPVFLMNLGWGADSVGWYNVGDEDLQYTTSQSHGVMLAPLYSVRFVGNPIPFGGDGTPDSPYYNLAEAMNEAPDGVTFFLRSGMDHKVSGSGAILDRPHVIKGVGATISYQ